MIKILALDTSTEACSVALMIGDAITSRFQIAPRKHGQLLLPMIHELLSEAGITLSQLSAIACSVGPGSFTGIRIAISVTQALAFACDLSVISVSTLAALAQGGYRIFNREQILVALNARMKQVYWGEYQIDSESKIAKAVAPDQVIHPEAIDLPAFQQALGIGPGWTDYREILLSKFADKMTKICADYLPNAEDVAILSQYKLVRGEMVSPSALVPNYLRQDVIG